MCTDDGYNHMANEKQTVNLIDYFKSGYVLVVDDMTNMRRTIKNMLRQIGSSNVMEADDGDTALNALRGNAGCRFILLDWNMPRMPGIHAAREIRADAATQDVPILMITAEVDRAQIAQAGEIGVNGYIIKPFVANLLAEKMRAILDARANPPEHVKLIKVGEELLRQGQHQKALQLFERAKDLRDTARIHVHIGEAFEMGGDADKAQASYATAIQQNPQFLKAHVKSADLHLKEGNQDAALESLQKAVEISPANADRHVTMGKIYVNKGDAEKAAVSFGAAVKSESSKASEIAEELLKMGKPEMAEHYFRRSLERSTDTIHTYNRLGISLRRQGKWKEAILEYETAIKIDPKDEGLYFNMAKAYVEGGNLKMAEKNFQRALDMNPDLSAAQRELEAIKKGTPLT